MAAGLKVFNTSNTIQITDEYKNYRFLSKRTVTMPTKIRNLSRQETSIADPNNNILAALVLTPTSNCNCIRRHSNGTTTFRIYSDAPSVEVYFFTFDDEPIPRENFGLEVFTEQGEIAFSSSMKPLIVSSFIVDSVDFKTAATSTVLASLSVDRKYAVISTAAARSTLFAPTGSGAVRFIETTALYSAVNNNFTRLVVRGEALVGGSRIGEGLISYSPILVVDITGL